MVLCELVRTQDKPLHLREIARRAGLSVSGTQAELKNLEAAGIVTVEKSGNQCLYLLNPECPLYPEICMMITKTVGVADEIKKYLKGTRGIKFAYIYGSFASGEYKTGSDVDLMLIGDVDPEKITGKLMPCEERIGREINAAVYSVEEYYSQRKIKNSFINQVHNGPKILIIGDTNDS
jgi:predicted nucleotidyltransferase